MIVAGGSQRLANGAHTRITGTVGDVYMTLADEGPRCGHREVPDCVKEDYCASRLAGAISVRSSARICAKLFVRQRLWRNRQNSSNTPANATSRTSFSLTRSMAKSPYWGVEKSPAQSSQFAVIPLLITTYREELKGLG